MGALAAIALPAVAFVALAVLASRRSRRRLPALVGLATPSWELPTSTDLAAAADELLDLDGLRAVSRSCEVELGTGASGVPIAMVAVRTSPVPLTSLWAVAELARPVLVPLTFASWRPRPIVTRADQALARRGAEPGTLVTDDRLGTTWTAWAPPDHDEPSALDADPTVWTAVSALAPALATTPDPQPGEPAPGFRLGPDVRVSVRGRFVVVGPGADPDLSGAASRDVLALAADLVVRTFAAAERG